MGKSSYVNLIKSGVFWADGFTDSGVVSLDIYWHPHSETYDEMTAHVISGTDELTNSFLSLIKSHGGNVSMQEEK